MEAHEHFVKQSYRNRCYILGANGPLMLNIPVHKGRSKTLIRDLQVDNRQNWQAIHWKSIASAYGNAPFFEFFSPEFKKVFEKQEKYLWDFNERLLTLCLRCIPLDHLKISHSTTFLKQTETGLKDLRSTIHPKKPFEDNSFYTPVPYIQVFGKKFVPNLSIIDLIFCQGPDARRILNESDVS